MSRRTYLDRVERARDAACGQRRTARELAGDRIGRKLNHWQPDRVAFGLVGADLTSACGRLINAAKASDAATRSLRDRAGFFIETRASRFRHPRACAPATRAPSSTSTRGAVPDLELRVRQRRAGRRALRRRGGGHRLLALHQPDRAACSRSGWPRSRAARACVATASGMAAILARCLAAAAGRRSRRVLAAACSAPRCSCSRRCSARFGIETTYVPPAPMPAPGRRRCGPNTRLLFVETPSNPLTEIWRHRALSRARARRRGALLVVDNCFCTPALQRPLELGADLVVHSATKYLDGQGRVLGGAVARPRKYVARAAAAGPAHRRADAVAVQRLGAAQGPGDAEAAHARRSRRTRWSLARWLEARPRWSAFTIRASSRIPQHALARASSAPAARWSPSTWLRRRRAQRKAGLAGGRRLPS